MTDDAQRYLKPSSVERLFGNILIFLVRMGVVRGHFYVLEVKGRKTGRTISLPVDPIEAEGRRYLVCARGESQWVRNARAAGEVALEVGIVDARLALGPERKADAQNDEASALAGVEDAGAIAEGAGLAAEFADLNVLVPQVEYLHGSNRAGDLLSVGADILHGRSAHAAGNAAEALDARAASHHGTGNKLIPGFAGADVKNNVAFFIVPAALFYS